MDRRIRKATAKDQILRIQAAAAAMVASANESVPVERKISPRSVERVVSRSLSKNKNLSFSERKFHSLRDVSDFISMAHHGKSNYASALNTDLLPVGNPLSTRKHLMSLSAFSHERARWVAADPRITDSEVRSLVASLLTSTPGSPEYKYYSSRISSLPQKSAPLVALIAAFGDGNSRAARSARARLQRRDRKGRFAWMGGGMSALVRRSNGTVNRLTGRFVAQGIGDDDTFDIEAPDGTLYRVPASSSEAVRAVITSDEAPDGYSPSAATVTPGAKIVNEADLVKIEAPQGFRKDKFYGGLGTRFTDDAYDVIKYDAGDSASANLLRDQDTDRPVYAVYRQGSNNPIGVSQSWADAQAAIRADEPLLDDEEGRESDPIARLTDVEFDDLIDNPKFDFGGDRKPLSLEEKAELKKILEESAPPSKPLPPDYQPDDNKLFRGETTPEEPPYAAVADLEDFEFNAPNGAYEPDLSSDYEPKGRTNQESPDYTDDPSVLSEYTESELSDALSQALLGDDPDNPDGSGFGELEFSEGLESVPAEALYEALYEAGVDPDMEVAKIYDRALGTTENQDALTEARRAQAGDEGEEQIAEIPEEVEETEAQLPPAIEGASEDEKNAYLESGDWTPFLQDNQEFEETGSYNLLNTDPYEPMSDEQKAEADIPDAVFDSPVDLANALSEEDLTNYLRESIEPDSDMPGMAAVSYEDEDGEIVEAYIPGEAIRDALQLQGVNTNELLDQIYSEPLDVEGVESEEDLEPDDDVATEIIDAIGAVDVAKLTEEMKIQDEIDYIDRRIAALEEMARFGQNMPPPGQIGMMIFPDEVLEKNKAEARKEIAELKKRKKELQSQLDGGKVAEIPGEGGEGTAPSGKKPSAPRKKRTGKGKPSKFYSPKPDGTPDEAMEYDQEYLKYLYESDLADLTTAELSDLQAMLSQISPEAKFLVSDKEAEVYEELIRRANMPEPDADTPASDYPDPKFVGEDPLPAGSEGPERRLYKVAGDLGITSQELFNYLNERYGAGIKSKSSKIPQDILEQFIVDHNELYGKDLLDAMNAWRVENDLPTTEIPEKKTGEGDSFKPAEPIGPTNLLEPKPTTFVAEPGDVSPDGDWVWREGGFGTGISSGWVPTAKGKQKIKQAWDEGYDPYTGEPKAKTSTTEEPAPEMSQEDKFMDEFGLDVDMSTWVKDGGQAGSNEGAFYTDPATGMRYYVKKPKSAKHARNEVLASAFYNEAGVRHGRIYIGKDADGNEVLISPIVQGDIKELGETDWQNDPEILASAQNGFVMDAWLNNWDSVGANYDNMIVKGKDVYRIDPGGALIFRAQGEDKADTLTPEAKQIDDLRFKGKKASSIFGSMTDEQITEDAKKLVGLSPERISELVDTAFSDDPETRDFIKENLLARRKTIMDRFGLTEDDFPQQKEQDQVAPDADELPGDTPENEEEIVEAIDNATPFTPDEPSNPVVDEATGDYSPEMKQLFDLFIQNPEAAKDFLDKVKENEEWSDSPVVNQLLEDIDKKQADTAETQEKDTAEKAADEVASEIVESSVDALDEQDQELVDLELEKEEFEKIDLELEDLLDDAELGSADAVIKKILESYEVINNGDGTFTLNSVTRVGADGKPEKLELKIQKNKDNTFSVLFVQTKWNQDGVPIEKVVDKYAPRHSFKALNNNVLRGKKWIAMFEANDSLTTDKFMKLASKNTYKKIAGDGAIETVKATHLSADGITELKVGDRVYNWKNGKWGTVAEVLPEYFGQGKNKVVKILENGEEVYGYADYLKVRWDDAPSKALPVVSNAVFKVDPETGYAVDTPVPTLYDSKGKPKPKQPKKPESPDPKNPSPATSAPAEPVVKPAPEPVKVEIPEPVSAPEPEPSADVTDIEDVEDVPELTDEQAQDIIDELGSKIGGIYNYKGKDVEVLNMNKDGVTYRDLETGEIGSTPLAYWNQEELDGVVDASKIDTPSDPNNVQIGDEWLYNASDGTTTDMTVIGIADGVKYEYTDKNGKKKVKTVSPEAFKQLAESGKITAGNAQKLSPKAIRFVKNVDIENADTASGPVPEAAPQVEKPVSDFDLDGSAPLEGFASVEDAISLVKERKKSGYQHRITYDGDAVADMEVVLGVAKVDGEENVTARFRLQGSVADQLEQNISNGNTEGISWSSMLGVIIPSRKRLKSGMKIDTTKDIGVYSIKQSGNTYTAELEDGTKIRFYRDKTGNGFVFGNTVEVYSPNKNFSQEDLNDVLQKLGVAPEKTTYPTKDSLRTLAEKRLLSYFKTGKHDKGTYKKDEAEKKSDLQNIKSVWGVTPDSVVIEQGPDGRLELSLPRDVAQRVVDFAEIDTLYATTQGKNIDVVLGGANPGMQSSSQRVFYGLFKTGAKTSSWSQESDMGTGGSDFVYLRPLKPGSNYNDGSTRIFVDPVEVVKRLDIFSYDSDSYGAKNPNNWNYKAWLGTYGNSGAGQPEMLKNAAKEQAGSPEIMVRHNIPLSAIMGYLYTSSLSRDEAIKKLKDLGITEVNGIPIEEFIKLNGPGMKKITPGKYVSNPEPFSTKEI